MSFLEIFHEAGFFQRLVQRCLAAAGEPNGRRPIQIFTSGLGVFQFDDKNFCAQVTEHFYRRLAATFTCRSLRQHSNACSFATGKFDELLPNFHGRSATAHNDQWAWLGGGQDLAEADAQCADLDDFFHLFFPGLRRLRAARINAASFPNSLDVTRPSFLKVSTRCTMTTSHCGMTRILWPR